MNFFCFAWRCPTSTLLTLSAPFQNIFIITSRTMSIDKSIHINVKGYYQHRNQNRKRIKWNSVLIKLHENSLHPNTELKNLLHDLERKKRVFRKERVFVIFLLSGVTGLRFLPNEFLKSFLKILEHFYKELCHQNFFINLQAKNYSN